MVAVPTLQTMRYPLLTKHDKLNFQTLDIIEMLLFTNAQAVPSFRGDRILGHTYLVLDQVKYTARAGVAFDQPLNPGNPPVLAAGATSSQIAISAVNYNTAKDAWSIYIDMNAILMTQRKVLWFPP